MKVVRVVSSRLIAVILTTLPGSAALGGCAAPSSSESTLSPAPSAAEEVLYQYSTLSALMAGVYDGELTIGELRSQGDLGLGTLDHLDGELIVVDGSAVVVGADGKVRPVADSELTPFAAVTHFAADTTFESSSTLTAAELKARIDQSRTSDNLPYAVRISGTFAFVSTRSVPAQERPYRPLPEVLQAQVEFSFEDVEGTIVGFWLPAYMDGANAGGYHLHFLTADGTGGGHLLDLVAADVTVSLDETQRWLTDLPSEGDFVSTELSTEQYG